MRALPFQHALHPLLLVRAAEDFGVSFEGALGLEKTVGVRVDGGVAAVHFLLAQHPLEVDEAFEVEEEFIVVVHRALGSLLARRLKEGLLLWRHVLDVGRIRYFGDRGDAGLVARAVGIEQGAALMVRAPD